jgi:hypothetical protein
MPVFGVGKPMTDHLGPIDQGQRDAEFQYLSDSNARVILSRVPDEPGRAAWATHT